MPLPGLRAGKRRGACAFVLLSLVLLMWFHFLPPLQPPFPLPVAPGSSLVPSSKPGNITVSGLVFYGRRDRASCLRCYLEENMVGRGGWLDEILWVVNTEEEDDLRYLEEIIASDPGRHKALYLPGETLSTYTYYKAWQRLDRGKYYVKVDDDIVWIADDAIPRLISQKLDHPECFAVSANVINNPPLGFIHYHVGALHPYLPEVAGPESSISTTSWKPSLDPFWSGPSDFTWPLQKRPPRQKHRWLRVKEEEMMSQTPAAQLKYEVWGDSYSSWAIAAQMHYSLLENIESDKLGLYKFRPPWDMHGERIRINFICFYADDILNTDISTWPRDRGDEDMIAIDLPKRLHRPIMLIGDALGAHLQYADQVDLAETDLLTRYQCLARDRGCQ